MRKIRILKEKARNETLIRDGFVCLDVLNQSEIQQLKEFYKQKHQEQKINGLFVSANQFDTQKANEISDFVSKTVLAKVGHIFDQVDMMGGTFIVKAAKTKYKLEPHQDWNIVDEISGRSYTLWIALETIDGNNGALYMLPGSHEKFRGFRHVSIPSIYGKVYDQVWKYMVPIYLKAGEGVLFDHAIGHASAPNMLDSDRVAVTCSLLTKKATYRFYCLEGNTIAEYVGEAAYYQTEEAKFGPGKLEKIGLIKQKPFQLSKVQLLYHFGIKGRLNSFFKFIEK